MTFCELELLGNDMKRGNPQSRLTEDEDAGSDSGDDEETRRIDYLRRHRVMLEQKRRLETERRGSELEEDNASICKRQQVIIDTKLRIQAQERDAQARKPLRGLRPLQSLPVLGTGTASTSSTVGMYTHFDALSADKLREIAEKQALRDMAPLNTRGKYHARYMKDAFPIAGTQLKLEKERELILAAKKKLLLSKAQESASSNSAVLTRGHNREGSRGHSTYRKLDFHVDKFSAVLQHEQTEVEAARSQRQVRLVAVQHREGPEQFWRLLHAQRYHETLAWLKTHRFRDVNVPVVIRNDDPVSSHGSGPKLVVDPNRDVGQTPLMAACRLHNVELVRALLDQGAAVYLRTANGDTACHFLFHDWPDAQTTTLRLATDTLVRANHTQLILQLLLSGDQSADANAQNTFGESVLQHCARLGLLECVKLLLSHHADANARDRTGSSALQVALAHGHDEIARLLQNHATIERTKANESERLRCEALLKQKRGALTASWSESPHKLLARLAVEDRRAGHLRNQFVDRHGHVIACGDDEADGDSDTDGVWGDVAI